MLTQQLPQRRRKFPAKGPRRARRKILELHDAGVVCTGHNLAVLRAKEGGGAPLAKIRVDSLPQLPSLGQTEASAHGLMYAFCSTLRSCCSAGCR